MIHNPKTIEINSRTFSIQHMQFNNGLFFSIWEGSEQKIGGLSLAVKVMEQVTSSTILPVKYGETFGLMLAETVASASDGISLISLFVSSELDNFIFQRIQKELFDIIP